MNSRVMLGLTLLAATSQAVAEFPGSLLADPGSLIRRAQPEAFAGLAVIEPLAMDEMRGGFSIGGINLSFGATARTMIDGVILQTVFQVNEAGSHIVSQQFTTGIQDSVGAISAAGAPSVSLAIQDFLSRFSVPVSISAGSGSGGASTGAPTAQANGSGASANAGGGASASAQGSGSSSGSLGGSPVSVADLTASGVGSPSAPPTAAGTPPAATTQTATPTATPAITATQSGGAANGGNDISAPTVVSTPAANVTAATAAGQPPAASTQAVSTAPASSGTIVLVGPDSGTSVTQVTPADVDLSGVADYSGIVIKDAQGFTAALHQLTQEAVRSAVISNKSGQQIRNELNIDIKVQNLREAAADNLRSSIMDSVQRRIGQ